MQLEGKSVVVTGGAGLIGSFLAERMGVDRAIRVPQFLISR